MSEFNPFGAAPQEQQDVAVVEEASEGRDKKVLVLGGVVALALAAGAYLFLGGGGEEELDSFAAPVRPAAAAPAASPSAPVEVPQSTAVRLGRSPFDVKYIAPAPAPAAEPTQAPAPVTTAAPPPQIVVVPVGSAPTSPAPSPAPEPQAQEYELILLRAFGEGADRSASFSIDGKEQTAKVGSVFGPTAEILLVSINEGPEVNGLTATIQVGDDDPFEVAVGEKVFVR